MCAMTQKPIDALLLGQISIKKFLFLIYEIHILSMEKVLFLDRFTWCKYLRNIQCCNIYNNEKSKLGIAILLLGNDIRNFQQSIIGKKYFLTKPFH